MSRPYFKFFRPFFSIKTKTKPDWERLAWDSQERLIKAERRLREADQAYSKSCFEVAKLRFEHKIGRLQCDLLRLRNNFNLCGALNYSLEEHQLGNQIKASKILLLEQLMRNRDYQNCRRKVSQRLQLRVADINPCTHALYHELLKHAHGNVAELVVSDTEYAIMEVAALEAVFCALKTKGCFQIPITIRIRNHEHTL